MLAEDIRDAAIGAAKKFGHEKAEPRHVLYGAVAHLRDKPGIEALLPTVRAALEPRGGAVSVPKLTPEADELVKKLVGAKDLVATLIELVNAGAANSGVAAQSPAGPVQPISTTQPHPIPTQVAPPPVETPAQVLAELDRLVGLASVKRQLATVAAVVQANQERVKAKLAPVSPGLHLVFTGPPGTGKTTVARLVARLYAAAGALPGSNFTEVSRADLIAGYVGQTAMKTAEVIQKTRPGVLFIDEAYALTPTHPSDFAQEAVSTLVKAMEDHRNEFAVIAAGYGDEMGEFIGSNPGLKSRFKTFIEFPDYNAEELARIFGSFADSAAIKLADGVLPAAETIFRRAVGQRDFGNARFARSLFERAYAKMAARALADGTLTVDEVSTIIVADLEYEETERDRVRKIGFND